MDIIDLLPTPTEAAPLRILLSDCLTGRACGYDASGYGSWKYLAALNSSAKVKLCSFCPEDFSFGTPRELCDLHGGTGQDALDGKAKLLNVSGDDWTAPMIRGAQQMLAVAQRDKVHLAIMMDVSASCGSLVIYDGSRLSPQKKYQKGEGITTALLRRNGFTVISQRDCRTLERLLHKIDPTHQIDPAAIDHRENPWYREYFAASK